LTPSEKLSLTERDICTKFVMPAIESAGWDIVRAVREQYYFTDGRVIVRGKKATRGVRKFVDILLIHESNIPIAIIEAKDNSQSVGSGMQQGLAYANTLDVPFVFSTNGNGFLFHDRLVTEGVIEKELRLDEFPSPIALWERYCAAKGLTPKTLPTVLQPYYSDGSGRAPRYFQRIAINRTIEAIANGEKRILLIMATGTGKTYTAFQIIWRLWKSGTCKRILFLADRNILVDQTKTNDFKPFGSAMTKITNRKIDPAYEIYLSLYQAVSSVDDQRNAYKEFSPDFFDLVVVDECHRGSATEDSSWREILDYFSSATQIGLTATPKEVKPKKGETLINDPEFNLKYFGNAIYTYSLKQGIEDGFLAPYKVVRIDIDKDLEGWRPTEEMKDKHGQIIQDRTYNQKDFDKTLVLEKRTTLVAQKITRFLKETNRFDKTIVFCEDIDHAERMRSALVNENADLYAINNKYVMRITGDSKEGKNELDQFILPEEKYPVIVTTSELMTTGVDAKTCKLIVLDKNIQSMTKFKQIIGRGTRIDEDYNKMYFTIMDFKKASERFSDTDFDGEPVAIHIPLPDESPVPPDEPVDDGKPTTGDPSNELETDKPNETGDGTEIITTGDDSDTGGGNQPPPPPPKPRIKYYVNNVEVSIVKERVQYYGPDGKLITESLTDYTRKQVHNEFPSLDQFLQKWSEADRKEAILEELEQSGHPSGRACRTSRQRL